MTPLKIFCKYSGQLKLYAIAIFSLFGLSRILIYLDNYYIASLFGYIVENPTQIITDTSLTYIAVYAGLHLGSSVTDSILAILDFRTNILLKRHIYNDLFKHIHKHSSSYFSEEMSGKISNKLLQTESIIRQLFWRFKGVLETLIIPYVVALPILFSVDKGLATSITFFCVITSFFNYYHCKNLKPISRENAQLESEAAGIIVDSIANARLVKNCGAVLHEKAYLGKTLKKVVRSYLKKGHETGISNSFNILSLMVLRVISLLILVYFWHVKNLNISQVLIALTYIHLLLSPIDRIGDFIIRYQQNLGALEDAINVLYKPIEVNDAPNAKQLTINTPNISIKNMSFAYENKAPLFEDFNLEINANEKVGIVGLSGSGKSTLINLILRAYDIKGGEIKISEQNIADVTQSSLRRHIALIPQEPSLFNRSIINNIRFSNPKASDEDVYKAAKLAQIHDTILKMPKGYQSVVGERGVKVSGGERQRIAIASAILKDTPILILDEATSALDSESETAIQKALQNIMKNKTVIAIAHRLSTLRNMDRIIVLEHGKIVESGAPKELLKDKSGKFYHLFNLQSDGFIQS